MPRRDVIRAIEWAIVWSTYVVSPDITEARRARAVERMLKAGVRLRSVWVSSGHFWLDS